jgi:hypothetical protein
MNPTQGIVACGIEWSRIVASHPEIVVRRTGTIPWPCVSILRWKVDPSPTPSAHAKSFIRRSSRLGRHGVTCKIYAARLCVGSADSSASDIAVVSERVDQTWAQLFRGRKPSAAAEHSLLQAIGGLLRRGYWHTHLTFNAIGMVGFGKSVNVKILGIRNIQRYEREAKLAGDLHDARLFAIIMLFPLCRPRRTVHRSRTLEAYLEAAQHGEGVFATAVDENYIQRSRRIGVDKYGRPLTVGYAWCGHPLSSRVRRQWSHGSTAEWRMVDLSAKGMCEVVTWSSRYDDHQKHASLAVQQACVDLLEALTDGGHTMLPLVPSNVMIVMPDHSEERVVFADIYATGRTPRTPAVKHPNKEASMAAHLLALTTTGRGTPMFDRLALAMSRLNAQGGAPADAPTRQL